MVMILPLESLKAGHGDLTGAIQAMIYHFLIACLENVQRLNSMRQQNRVRQGEQRHRLAEIDSDDLAHPPMIDLKARGGISTRGDGKTASGRYSHYRMMKCGSR